MGLVSSMGEGEGRSAVSAIWGVASLSPQLLIVCISSCLMSLYELINHGNLHVPGCYTWARKRGREDIGVYVDGRGVVITMVSKWSLVRLHSLFVIKG